MRITDIINEEINLISAPCGSGKSEAFIEEIKKYHRWHTNKLTICTVPSIDLEDEYKKRMEKAGIKKDRVFITNHIEAEDGALGAVLEVLKSWHKGTSKVRTLLITHALFNVLSKLFRDPDNNLVKVIKDRVLKDVIVFQDEIAYDLFSTGTISSGDIDIVFKYMLRQEVMTDHYSEVVLRDGETAKEKVDLYLLKTPSESCKQVKELFNMLRAGKRIYVNTKELNSVLIKCEQNRKYIQSRSKGKKYNPNEETVKFSYASIIHPELFHGIYSKIYIAADNIERTIWIRFCEDVLNYRFGKAIIEGGRYEDFSHLKGRLKFYYCYDEGFKNQYNPGYCSRALFDMIPVDNNPYNLTNRQLMLEDVAKHMKMIGIYDQAQVGILRNVNYSSSRVRNQIDNMISDLFDSAYHFQGNSKGLNGYDDMNVMISIATFNQFPTMAKMLREAGISDYDQYMGVAGDIIKQTIARGIIRNMDDDGVMHVYFPTKVDAEYADDAFGNIAIIDRIESRISRKTVKEVKQVKNKEVVKEDIQIPEHTSINYADIVQVCKILNKSYFHLSEELRGGYRIAQIPGHKIQMFGRLSELGRSLSIVSKSDLREEFSGCIDWDIKSAIFTFIANFIPDMGARYFGGKFRSLSGRKYEPEDFHTLMNIVKEIKSDGYYEEHSKKYGMTKKVFKEVMIAMINNSDMTSKDSTLYKLIPGRYRKTIYNELYKPLKIWNDLAHNYMIDLWGGETGWLRTPILSYNLSEIELNPRYAGSMMTQIMETKFMFDLMIEIDNRYPGSVKKYSYDGFIGDIQKEQLDDIIEFVSRKNGLRDIIMIGKQIGNVSNEVLKLAA